VQGEGGYIFPPDDFFPALRDLCDRYDILLIVDEVQSGMGRTGKWWAIEHYGVEPDILLTAKGIASGMPLGAMVAKKHIMNWPKGSHGNTYGGNPISCAAALMTIQLIKRSTWKTPAWLGLIVRTRLKSCKPSTPASGMSAARALCWELSLC